MTLVRVAINGFGRIGRLVFRAGYKELDIVAINDLGDVKTMAHLLKYDSTHGKLNANIEVRDKNIVVDGKEIVMCAERDPEKLPWKELGIDVVVESTGFFTKKKDAEKHIKAGAKKVLISAPYSGDDPVKTIVMGVNEHEYNKETDHVISNASCTTNCLAPVVKVLNDNFGVKRGLMTTVHAVTNDQNVLDLPHKDLRRARSAYESIIPTTTGAAKAVALVIPQLKGKLHGMAMRVPVKDASIVDFTAELNKEASVDQINSLFKSVTNNELKGIIEYCDEPLVSFDMIGNKHSSIFDSQLTQVIEGNLIKVVAWYDNEWGYSNRMVDVVKLMMR